VTADEEALVAARRLAIFGEDTPPTGPGRYRAYWSQGVGWNYRSHELTAALARSQLRRLDGWIATTQRNAALLSAGLDEIAGLEPPRVPAERTSVFYRYRIRIRPDRLGFPGPPVELRDRLLWALQAEGMAASLWQLQPLPAQPVFRRGRRAPWRPGDDGPLAAWDPATYPETARLLESSIVLGTADAPLFNQPPELMESYLEAFRKVLGSLDAVLRADYRPVQPWPPTPAGAL
jgi:dTDP-4-amino-4,6-dideoxygalactose transaminase